MHITQKDRSLPMKKMTFTRGERVAIVAGKYKKHGYGVYQGDYGKVMCSVVVAGIDEVKHIWKSSVAKIPKKTSDAAPDSGDDHDVMMIKRQEYTKLMNEVSELTKRMETLQLKLERLGG